MRSVVHKAYAQIKLDGKVKLFRSENKEYQDGQQKRDFLYVKDAVAMTLHLAESASAAGLYNLGSGFASTWIELVTPIFESLGKPINIEFVDLPDVLRGKYQYYTCADITRLRLAGWSGPGHNLNDAVRDYVVNYLSPKRRLGEVG
jgi:ADP-L-glycero-D-manno-heptose 6-epimerase